MPANASRHRSPPFRNASSSATARCGNKGRARLGRTVLTYRGRWSLASWAAIAALPSAGVVAGVLLPTGATAAVILLVWAAITLRVIRLAPACPAPGGGPGPGGAGVHEPRRPKPCPPSGTIGLPLPEDPHGGAAALA